MSNLQLWDFFSKGLKNEFETAIVNEPSVFEPLKSAVFICSCACQKPSLKFWFDCRSDVHSTE